MSKRQVRFLKAKKNDDKETLFFFLTSVHISTLVDIQTFMILISKSSEQTYLGFLCLCVGNLRHSTRVGASCHRGARAEGDDRGGRRSFTAVASHCCQATHYCNHCNIERSWGYAQPALPPGKERGWGEVEGWPLVSLRGWCTNLHFSLCVCSSTSVTFCQPELFCMCLLSGDDQNFTWHVIWSDQNVHYLF